MVGRPTEARQISEEVLKRGLERLERPAQPDIPWDVRCMSPGLIALSGDNTRRIVTWISTWPTELSYTCRSGSGIPSWMGFKNDPEFQTILADLKQKLEVARRSIREHEATAT